MLPEALSNSRIAQLDLYLKSRGHEHYDLDPLHWKDDYDAWLLANTLDPVPKITTENVVSMSAFRMRIA